jgi:hypothetical protein
VSGYLQRLVRAASRPDASVHPVAGSIFAAGREKAPDRFVREESGPTANPVTPIASDIPQSKTTLDSSRSPATDADYRPIAPVNVTRAEEQSTPRDVGWVREEPSAIPEDSPTPLPDADPESAQPQAGGMQKRMFVPLLAAEFVAEPVVAIPSVRADGPDFHAARGPAAIPHQSEDIQIHIGRIEVTAVQPPVNRVPKSPDRGPSLDAYLKRRAR